MNRGSGLLPTLSNTKTHVLPIATTTAETEMVVVESLRSPIFELTPLPELILHQPSP